MRISRVVNGERRISPDTALRLARYFGTRAEVWMGLQATYDLESARDTHGTWIEAEMRPRGR